MYFITIKRMLEVCFSAHPNIQYRAEKSTSGSLCVPDVLLIHKSIIYSFRSTSYISYRFRMDTDRSGKSYVYCGLCQMPSARGTALFFSPQSGLHPTAEAHTAR